MNAIPSISSVNAARPGLVATFDPMVKVVAHSISPEGIELPTIQFRQPRMIHSDFLTHRVFTRNGRSSRAVPVLTLLTEARNPYTPHFLHNQPGMTASQEFSDEERAEIEAIWREMAAHTVAGVERLQAKGVHKQWANRPLEWFGYIDVLLSSTDWNNYYALRDDEGAQPEIQVVARAIREAIAKSTPRELRPGQWHLPYIDEEADREAIIKHLVDSEGGFSVDQVDRLLRKISAARCARLTIRPFDGDGSIPAELERYRKLVVSRPVHASPTEHQATPDTRSHYTVVKALADGTQQTIKSGFDWDHPEEQGNFTGWRQARKQIPFEYVA